MDNKIKMDNKQAIEWLEYIKNGYSWSANCDKALDKAIASLEAWDKIKEELEREMNEYENVLSDLSYSDGVGYAFAVIEEQEEHLKEIEE